MADVTEIKSVAALRKQTILFTEPVMSSHGGRLWCGPLNEGPPGRSSAFERKAFIAVGPQILWQCPSSAVEIICSGQRQSVIFIYTV